ncbi:MAG: hypothetical protein ACD_78C00156G0009 [uncultured bacterium (gcode 4)]|uniref:Methylated-DNA-[protein]-cysteine S-methyltransferase DNA binding domain-containing protein n=1 Tax=uncultured bacterium (gcode 4) TaxID=1234023 RepID=K1YCS9_9BACT|nr:MAG: hypothetical protein ACD_78C00156G0009 [uncultured bacterium (gcode 4)]
MSPLRTALYNTIRLIPRGKVATYGILAKHFHTSPRAIASMLAANTLLDTYPCYRIIHTDGRIGGYREWTEEKIRRLYADGIKTVWGKIDLWKHEFTKF